MTLLFTKIGNLDKLVLAIVYNEENYFGKCQISDASLALILGRDRQGVYRSIHQLIEKGLIKKYGKSGRGNVRLLITTEKFKTILARYLRGSK